MSQSESEAISQAQQNPLKLRKWSSRVVMFVLSTLAEHMGESVTLREALFLITVTDVGLDGEQLTVTEAAKRAGIPVASASRLAVKLVDKGFLKYKSSDRDGRETLLVYASEFLEQEGLQACQELRELCLKY